LDREPTRILILAANPFGFERLRLDKEIREIQSGVEHARVPFDFRQGSATRPSDLSQKLLKLQPQLVHFCGHGREEGIILEDEAGAPKFVEASALAAVFKLFSQKIRCVVLNCCLSRAQAKAISVHIPFVIGMNAPISDDTAIAFSVGFYEALGEDFEIGFAFEYALARLRLEGLPDFEVPEIFVKGEAITLEPKDSGRPQDTLEPTSQATDGGSLKNTARWPASVEDLDSLTREEFERFSLEILESMYQGFNLRLEPIGLIEVQEADSEAQYLLGMGPRESKVVFRIWLEIKHRSERNIEKVELASHIVDALIDNVSKVILITNRTFTRAVYAWLHDFSARTGLQYQLIDGMALLRHARAFRSVPAGDSPDRSDTVTGDAPAPVDQPGSPDLTLKCWFSLSPLDRRPEALYQIPIAPRPERPLYLVVDVVGSSRLEPCRIELRATIDGLHALPVTQGAQARLISAGEHVRQMFVIWPNVSDRPTVPQISVDVQAGRPLEIERFFLNSVKMPPTVLADGELRSQSRALATVFAKLDRWKALGEFFSALVVAPPGLGKSRIMAIVRQRCQSEGISEIFLDCESVSTDVDLLRHLIQHVLPFSPGFLDADLAEPVQRWCLSVGMAQEVAAQLAEDLCTGTGKRLGAANDRVEVAMALLGHEARFRPLALIVEDLHKASPSLLSFLSTLISRLTSSGTTNAILVASTRPFFHGAANLRSEWLAGLSSMGSVDKSIVLELEPPSKREARELLQASIVGFEEHQAEALVETVGSSPFSLRESVLFLVARLHLESINLGDRLALALVDPGSLRLASMSDELANATEQRIQLLFENQPDWLQSLLLAGAIFGRRFPLNLILDAIHIDDDEALGHSLDTCSSWSLLSSSSGAGGWLEFDHDLVREAVLTTGSSRSRAKMARAVLETLGPRAQPQIRSRLAYQAELPEACLAAIDEAKALAHAEGRVADVVELNQLAIQVLDPDVAEGVLSELLKTGEQHFLDPALRRLGTCIAPLAAGERMKRVLQLLLENVRNLSTVGSGSSGAVEAAITEARLIAERNQDKYCIAQLLYYEGRMWFERNVIEKSMTLHQQAESLFSSQERKRDSARAENLIRQAICLRRTGNRDDSIAFLREAARQRPYGDWLLISKVRSNMGAAYLASDWSNVRYHWERQIRQAVRRGLISRKVHALASLSFIDLFEGKIEDGLARAQEALEDAERLRLDNEVVRLCLNLSVHSMMTGDPPGGRLYLLKAEELALRHGIGRRLWRVSANLATVYEAMELREDALSRDLQSLRHLAEPLSTSDLIGRSILPLVNALLRARMDPRFTALLEHVPAHSVTVAQGYSVRVIEGQKHQLPGLLGNYCVDLAIGPRFLLTE
jgi:tetratricopeptide (TPR) repeat protein